MWKGSWRSGKGFLGFTNDEIQHLRIISVHGGHCIFIRSSSTLGLHEEEIAKGVRGAVSFPAFLPHFSVTISWTISNKVRYCNVSSPFKIRLGNRDNLVSESSSALLSPFTTDSGLFSLQSHSR